MKLARTLYVLTTLTLAAPALAADAADGHAGHGNAATHDCAAMNREGKMHHDGKVQCTCVPAQDEPEKVSRAPESPAPVFTDAG